MSSDPTQVGMVPVSAFPVLHLKPPVKIADLSTFAAGTLGMILPHKALRKMTCLLKLTPINSRCLLSMPVQPQHQPQPPPQ